MTEIKKTHESNPEGENHNNNNGIENRAKLEGKQTTQTTAQLNSSVEEDKPYDPYSWADEPVKPKVLEPKIEEVEQVEQEETPAQEEVFYFTEADLPKYPPARALSEGALLSALAAVLGLLAYYVPVVGIIATFIWPIPLSLLILRQGLGWGLLGTVITAAVLTLFTGPLNGLLLIINMAGVGIWYGYSYRKGVKPIKALAVGSVIAAISAAILVMLSNYVMGLPLMGIADQLEKLIKEAVAMYQNSGLLNNLPAGISVDDFTESLITTMKALVPGAFVIAAMAIAFISYFLTCAVFGRLGYRRHELPRFREWHLSWVFLWGLIIAFAGLLGGRFWGYEWMKLLGMNVLYIYSPILILCGISLLAWFWSRWAGSPIRLIIVFAFILLFQYSLYALLIMGLTDTVFDIRKQITAVEAQLKKNNKGGRR
ncbi:MAG: YybS family protein [Clostridia bacterium]|nr:YybS family protein [Clostridia bacterium]